MKRDPVSLIWLAGIGLAVLIYVVDPGQILLVAGQIGRDVARGIDLALSHFTLVAFDAVRALALAAFGIFVALSLLSIRRGGRGRTALLAVTAVFLLLVAADSTVPGDGRWGEALLLSGVAALVMTRRVRGGVPARLR